jgi:hypothetical protein
MCSFNFYIFSIQNFDFYSCDIVKINKKKLNYTFFLMLQYNQNMKKLIINLSSLTAAIGSAFLFSFCANIQKESFKVDSVLSADYKEESALVLHKDEKCNIDLKNSVDAIKSKNIKIDPKITALVKTISETKEFPKDLKVLSGLIPLLSTPIMTTSSTFYSFGGFEISTKNNLSVKNKPITNKSSKDLSNSENNIHLFGFDTFDSVSLKERIVDSQNGKETLKTGDDFIGSAFINGVLNSDDKIKGVEVTGKKVLEKTSVSLYYFTLDLSFNKNVDLFDFATLFLAGYNLNPSDIKNIPSGFKLPSISSVLEKINCNVTVTKMSDLNLTVLG